MASLSNPKQNRIMRKMVSPTSSCAHNVTPLLNEVERIIDEHLSQLTSEPALASFREAWARADAEGATSDRVRQGMVAAIEAVSS